MLASLLSIIGYLILIVTTVLTLSGVYPALLPGLVGGMALIALSRILTHVEHIRDHLLGIPMSRQTVQMLESKASSYLVASESLQLRPSEAPEYKLLQLKDEAYIRVDLFKAYVKEHVNYQYTFQFPGEEPLVLDCAESYMPEADLFQMHHKVYVKLSSLPVRWNIRWEGLIIEHESFNPANN
ncbi:hypothetical protein [Paenibacillus sp. 1P07SE]|uniref:hypothetical protein n=1 Tax=Paenibacillus sp. 1P07SE TaxID=3132209 RepID=UPI0039A61017